MAHLGPYDPSRRCGSDTYLRVDLFDFDLPAHLIAERPAVRAMPPACWR